MANTRIAAVTGANKGIGFAIVRNLALQYPQSRLNSGPLLIYLTARDEGRGEQALKDIQNDPQLTKAKALRKDGGLTEIQYHQLDISDQQSITKFEEFLKKQHPDGIDVLINNAGIAMTGFDSNVVNKTIASNYYGTLHTTQTMLPHMRRGGRIVNVSSMGGKLNKYSPQITQAFKAATSVNQMSTLMDQYVSSVEKGTHSTDGWPSAAYSVSKSGVTGMSGIIGRSDEAKAREVLVNSCCPGYVSTDMTKNRGRKTPDEGAQTPVLLALGDLKGISGEFWEREEVSSW